jgi:hypothetical protein
MLKANYDIIVSSSETTGAFNTGFGTVNLHRLTMSGLTLLISSAPRVNELGSGITPLAGPGVAVAAAGMSLGCSRRPVPSAAAMPLARPRLPVLNRPGWGPLPLLSLPSSLPSSLPPSLSPSPPSPLPSPLPSSLPPLRRRAGSNSDQGLTLVPNSAELELFCPPCNPT